MRINRLTIAIHRVKIVIKEFTMVMPNDTEPKDEKVKVTLALPAKLVKEIDQAADADLRTRTNFCERLLASAFNGLKKSKQPQAA